MSHPTVVLKFGGTSVASVERWRTIAHCIVDRLGEGLRPVVVCSAVAGISDQLVKVADLAPEGRHEAVVQAIAERHRALAAEMGVDPAPLEQALAELSRLALGASLTGEVSPRLRARLMAWGELTSTRLGAAWMAAQGIDVTWLDARDLLTSADPPGTPAARRYLSATCAHDADAGLRARVGALSGAVLTQGFIARDRAGDMVVLGRGGSDTSASILAARLGAVRCEIWTDVPGMFTANPRQVPAARLIRAVDYDEAQEIASTGAKVLHPRCLPPVRDAHVPLFVKCTEQPDLPGTVVADADVDRPAGVKAISMRSGLVLVSMETLGMWGQAGFLADAFACFKAHGVSIDLVSTSESNVTVSLDPATQVLDAATLDRLVADLAAICQPRLIRDCASVSLVGRHIRRILHRLAPALEAFEEQRIHLLTQAASDLNLTFVVDGDQADRVVRDLHAHLFGADAMAVDALGPTWTELSGKGAPARPVGEGRWWRHRRDDLTAIAAQGTPRYVYDGATLCRGVAGLRALTSVSRVLYAVKANANADVLRRLFDAGVGGFECVSPGELAHVAGLFPDLQGRTVLFTPNFAPRAEYERAFAAGATVTLDNLHPLEAWPDVFRFREVFVRLDPGRGMGHHHHVRTAGTASKFGIAPDQLGALARLVARAGARVVGLHAHVGSGVREPEAWARTGAFLADVATNGGFAAHVRVLDLGGGLGVPEKPGEPTLDLAALDRALARLRGAHPHLELWLEPGRYLVAEAGVLLARVTQLKQKGDVTYVGVDAGMNSLIRPALYGAWHEIVNLTRLDEERTATVHVVGPICESGDTLGHDRRLPPSREGDVILVGVTGAYGAAMASRYNLREPAAEVVI